MNFGSSCVLHSALQQSHHFCLITQNTAPPRFGSPQYAADQNTNAMPSDPHVPELKVLRRKEPTLEDENEWPQFDVRDVEVRDFAGEICSLFSATPDNPVTLTGTLITKSEPDRGISTRVTPDLRQY